MGPVLGRSGSRSSTLRCTAATPFWKQDTLTSADAARRRQMKSTSNAPSGQETRKNRYSIIELAGAHEPARGWSAFTEKPGPPG